MIKLLKHDSLMSLENVCAVEKLDIKDGQWITHVYIKIEYYNREPLKLWYGADDGYLHEDNNQKRRDIDFIQLQSLLLKDK